MKTSLNQKFNSLEELNAKGDNVQFSHKYLRAKLIAQKYFTKNHTKGMFYVEIENGKKYLMVAYASLNGKPIYAPYLSAPIK